VTITIKGLVKGSVLHLGNSPHGMIQSIVHATIGTSNLREELGRCLIAVIGGKLHSKCGKHNNGISGNVMEDPSSPQIPLNHSLPSQSQ